MVVTASKLITIQGKHQIKIFFEIINLKTNLLQIACFFVIREDLLNLLRTSKFMSTNYYDTDDINEVYTLFQIMILTYFLNNINMHLYFR